MSERNSRVPPSHDWRAIPQAEIDEMMQMAIQLSSRESEASKAREEQRVIVSFRERCARYINFNPYAHPSQCCMKTCEMHTKCVYKPTKLWGCYHCGALHRRDREGECMRYINMMPISAASSQVYEIVCWFCGEYVASNQISNVQKVDGKLRGFDKPEDDEGYELFEDAFNDDMADDNEYDLELAPVDTGIDALELHAADAATPSRALSAPRGHWMPSPMLTPGGLASPMRSLTIQSSGSDSDTKRRRLGHFAGLSPAFSPMSPGLSSSAPSTPRPSSAPDTFGQAAPVLQAPQPSRRRNNGRRSSALTRSGEPRRSRAGDSLGSAKTSSSESVPLPEIGTGGFTPDEMHSHISNVLGRLFDNTDIRRKINAQLRKKNSEMFQDKARAMADRVAHSGCVMRLSDVDAEWEACTTAPVSEVKISRERIEYLIHVACSLWRVRQCSGSSTNWARTRSESSIWAFAISMVYMLGTEPNGIRMGSQLLFDYDPWIARNMISPELLQRWSGDMGFCVTTNLGLSESTPQNLHEQLEAGQLATLNAWPRMLSTHQSQLTKVLRMLSVKYEHRLDDIMYLLSLPEPSFTTEEGRRLMRQNNFI